MAYQSGEFLINKQLGNYTYYPSAAAVFNGSIVLITSWGWEGYDYTLTQTNFPLNKLISHHPVSPEEPVNDDALKDPANWTSKNLGIQSGFAKPALVVLPAQIPDTLFLFHNSPLPYPKIFALRYPLNDEDQSSNNQWSPQIALFESDGINIPAPTYLYNDISATAIGDNIVIVTCASASPQPDSPGEFAGGGTFVGIYDKRNIDLKKNTWKAEYSHYLPYRNQLNSNNSFRVLTEWYARAADNPDKDGNTSLEYQLVVFILSGDIDPDNNVYPKMNGFCSPMTIGDDGSVALTGFFEINPPIRWDAGEPPMFWLTDLKRDPAGRLKSWYHFTDFKQFMTANLHRFPGSNEAPPGTFIIKPATGHVTASEVSNYSANPSSVFYTAGDGQYKTKIKAPKEGAHDLAAVNYPVYEFVFYGLYPKCQVNRCGTIQVVTDGDDNQRSLKQLNPEEPVYIIGGIFNGPIPVPVENYKDIDPGSSEMNAGSLTYGVEKTDAKSRKISKSFSAGFESEGKTTKGVGIAFKIAFHAGGGSVDETKNETDTVQNITQDARITYNEQKKEPKAVPTGIIRVVKAAIKTTAFSYIDNFGVSVDSIGFGKTEGPKTASIAVSFEDNGDLLEFIPYAVIPGDLTSYKPEAINQKMNVLGYDGSKPGYPGENNYFGDVICQNALPIGDAGYLEMTWTPGGNTSSGFSQIHSSYQESNWGYEASLYAGVSGGGGFSIFGLGEEFEASILGGVDFSRDTAASEDKETKWGIEIGKEWGPPVNDELKTAVKHYAFRIYFLPVPKQPSVLPQTYWTTELLNHLPADDRTKKQIDPNSACWRIFYVVTKIEYNDGTSWEYDGSLDKPSVYLSGNVPVPGK